MLVQLLGMSYQEVSCDPIHICTVVPRMTVWDLSSAHQFRSLLKKVASQIIRDISDTWK